MNRLRVIGWVIGPSLVCGAAGGASELGMQTTVTWPTHGWSKQAPAVAELSESVLAGLDADLLAGTCDKTL
jgi:hypothetical protein